MIVKDLQFNGQANPVQVKDNTGLAHVAGALGVSGM